MAKQIKFGFISGGREMLKVIRISLELDTVHDRLEQLTPKMGDLIKADLLGQELIEALQEAKL